MSKESDLLAFITARLDERAKALSGLVNRRAPEAIPAIEMQMHHAMQIATSFPRHGMSHFEFEAWQELVRGIEVKRRIMNGFLPCAACLASRKCLPHDASFGPPDLGAWRFDDDRDEDLARLLASEWPTHPDYRTEWSA